MNDYLHTAITTKCADYPMRCCNFHATGGHSADRPATKVYVTEDVDAFLREHGDPGVPNRNVRMTADVASAEVKCDPF